jgi:hypothetical protein
MAHTSSSSEMARFSSSSRENALDAIRSLGRKTLKAFEIRRDTSSFLSPGFTRW